MVPTTTDSTVKAALDAIASESATTLEKIEMLIELAHGFQKKPKATQDLWNAVELSNRAEEMCGEDYPLLKARAQVGKARALRTIPDEGTESLLQAKAGYEQAIPILQKLAAPEEIAEAQMNLGLVLQSLAQLNLAKMGDSIKVYQDALQVFTSKEYPQEYAILYNNIAIAYLSIPAAKEQKSMCQDLAVQTFESALKHINLIEHPKEYAMLQNNLGNALQYLQSIYPVENNLRAVAAYDEALKVRNARDTPLEYANTISNKANALLNLPDDVENPESENHQNLLKARDCYQEALELFTQYQQLEQAKVVAQVLQEINQVIGVNY